MIAWMVWKSEQDADIETWWQGICYFILAQSIIERVASGMMAIISFFKKKNE